jgi:hypothetical protein
MSEEMSADAGQPVSMPDETIAPVEMQSDVQEVAPAEQTVETPTEQPKTFTQEQVQAIAAENMRRGMDKAMRQMQAQQQQYQAQAVQQNHQEGVEAPVTVDDIARVVQNNLEQKRAAGDFQSWANQLEESIESKVSQAKILDPSFGDTYEKLDLHGDSAYLAVYLDKVPNTTEVMKELVNDPIKLGSLLTLLYSRQDRKNNALLQNAVDKISKSILQNKAAASYKAPKEPLDQVRPSNLGKSDGEKSVSDYRKMFRG